MRRGWLGNRVDPYAREFSDGDLTVTVQSNDDPLGAWNGNTHIGHGIGDTDRQVWVEMRNWPFLLKARHPTRISFHLRWFRLVGSWKKSRHFTEVEIRAFQWRRRHDRLDDLPQRRSWYVRDRLHINRWPTCVLHELGTVQGSVNYLCCSKHDSVSQTCNDEAVFYIDWCRRLWNHWNGWVEHHAGDNEIRANGWSSNITLSILTEGSKLSLLLL